MNKKMNRLLSFVLSFTLIQSQVIWAQGEAHPAPQQRALVESIEMVKGPEGKVQTVYKVQGPKRILDGQLRVWTFNSQQKIVHGTVVDPARNIVHWDGQKAPALIDPLSPSQVMRTTTWNEEHKRRMKDLTDRFRKGDRSLIHQIQTENRKYIERQSEISQKSGRFTQVGIAFYMAMGLLAGIVLARDYAHNPNAWSDYLDFLNSPVGWLMLPTFILASHGTTRFLLSRKKFKVSPLAATGLGMVAGLLTTTILGQALSDPDLKQALGFTEYDKNGRFTLDEVAMDRLKHKWAGEELLYTIVPLIGHAALAGGIALGAAKLLKMGLNATNLAQKIRLGASFLKKPRGQGLISIVVGAGSMVVFMGAFQISYAVVDLETELRDQVLIRRKFPNALNKLTQSFNKSLKGQESTLAEDLEAHSQLMAQWRGLRFKEVDQTYQAWYAKNQALVQMSSAAFQTYRNFLVDLSEHKKGNLVFFSEEVQEIQRANSNQASGLDGLNIDYNDVYKMMSINDHHDYLLTSMACGPIAGQEGNQSGVFGKLASFFASENVPSQMVEYKGTQKSLFHPPRLVSEALPNICATEPYKLLSSGFKTLDRVRRFVPEIPVLGVNGHYTPSMLYGQVNGESFRGIQDYLLKALPEELTTGNVEARFLEWWQAHVNPSLETANEKIMGDYQHFLDSTYTEVLTSDSSLCKALPEATVLNGTRELLRGSGLKAPCSANENLILGEGLANSITQQMAFYLNLLSRVNETSGWKNEELSDLSTEILQLTHHVLLEVAQGSTQLSRAAQLVQVKNELRALTDHAANDLSLKEHERALFPLLSDYLEATLNEGLHYLNPLTGNGVLNSLTTGQ